MADDPLENAIIMNEDLEESKGEETMLESELLKALKSPTEKVKEMVSSAAKRAGIPSKQKFK